MRKREFCVGSLSISYRHPVFDARHCVLKHGILIEENNAIGWTISIELSNELKLLRRNKQLGHSGSEQKHAGTHPHRRCFQSCQLDPNGDSLPESSENRKLTTTARRDTNAWLCSVPTRPSILRLSKFELPIISKLDNSIEHTHTHTQKRRLQE